MAYAMMVTTQRAAASLQSFDTKSRVLYSALVIRLCVLHRI